MGLIGKKTGTETTILQDFNGIVKPGEVSPSQFHIYFRCY